MQTKDLPEAEGGIVRSPPWRDKQHKFNLGASLQEQDQLRVLAMLNANSDRPAFQYHRPSPQPIAEEGGNMAVGGKADGGIPRAEVAALP